MFICEFDTVIETMMDVISNSNEVIVCDMKTPTKFTFNEVSRIVVAFR